MSRITEIRDVAASSTANLADALLQCLVLADELDYEPLSDWVNMELGGYDDLEHLPDYRITNSNLQGILFEGNRYTKGYIIPESFIDDRLREQAQTVYIADGVGKLMSLSDDGTLRQRVAGGDLVEGLINNHLHKEYGPYYGVRSVELPIPPGTYADVLSAVRHRIVQFMIEMNRMFPSDDQLEANPGEKLDRVDEVFKGIVNIGRAERVVVAGSVGTIDKATSVTTNIFAGDFGSLAEYLKSLGVPDHAISGLEPITGEIANGDRSEVVEQSLKDWVGEQVSDLSEAAGNIAADSAKRTLTETIVQGIKDFAPNAAEWISSMDFPVDSWPR